MDPTSTIKLSSSKGLYIVAFGYGYIYHLSGGLRSLVLIVVTTILAAYLDTLTTDISRQMMNENEINSVRDTPMERWRDYINLPGLRVVAVILGVGIYIWSIWEFGTRGRESIILGTIALSLFIIAIRSFMISIYYGMLNKMAKGI